MSGANFAMILSHVLVMMNNGLVEPHDGLTTDEIATESYSSVQEKDRFVFYVKNFQGLHHKFQLRFAELFLSHSTHSVGFNVA